MKMKFLPILIAPLLVPGLTSADGFPQPPATQPVQILTAAAPKEQLSAALESARARYAKDATDAAALNEQLHKLLGDRLDTSRDALHKEAAKADEDSDDATLAADATNARKAAIMDQINLQLKKGQAEVDKDPVVGALQKVVDIREKDVARISALLAKAAATPENLDQANADLAEARAQLELQRQRAESAAGGDVIDGLQKELVDATISQAEQAVRLDELKQRRATLRKALGILEQLNTIERDAGEACIDINNDMVYLKTKQTQPTRPK